MTDLPTVLAGAREAAALALTRDGEWHGNAEWQLKISRQFSSTVISAFLSHLREAGYVIVPKAILEHVSWQYDAAHMLYFCPWCQKVGDGESPSHDDGCTLSRMIEAASEPKP